MADLESYKQKLKAAIEAEVELTWSELDMNRATFMTLNKHDILPIQAGQMQRMIQALDYLIANNFKQICEAQLKLIEALESIAELPLAYDGAILLNTKLKLAKQALADLVKGQG